MDYFTLFFFEMKSDVMSHFFCKHFFFREKNTYLALDFQKITPIY